MAHGERSRAYGRVGSSDARAFRTAMTGAPFDGPRQERAEARRRPAAGPTDGLGWRSGLSWAAGRETGRERAEALRAGGWSESGGTAWAELGEARQGREDTQRAGGWSRWAHAVEGNQIRSHHDDTLPLILYLALVLPWPGAESKRRSRSERARRRGPSPILSPTLYLVIVLPWPGAERATPRARRGLERRPRRERARLRGPSPHLVSFRLVSFRLVSFRLVSFRLLRLPADPPPIGEVDREEPYRGDFHSPGHHLFDPKLRPGGKSGHKTTSTHES